MKRIVLKFIQQCVATAAGVASHSDGIDMFDPAIRPLWRGALDTIDDDEDKTIIQKGQNTTTTTMKTTVGRNVTNPHRLWFLLFLWDAPPSLY